ncbi:hypothetical protein [Flavobacterium sharifuzzamanii]|uniref:hypothetical protein n=1 Tax=Flavobacterium sharifuzzamanii TaxID=2211133 RepID=UPI000DAB70EB|nr:hypothetical protein [Flavobacterium sharifuzzamanii]KAF2082010.1 hypothetical protein DMA14_05945 [Flavobacterium sharifuzzamanii]
MKYTLGILDEETDQIELIEACFQDDFNIVKIDSIDSIDDLLDIIKSEKIDVLSIDYKLKDHNSGFIFNGDYFFSELLDKFGDFPAFVLTNDVENAKKESKKINPRFIVDKAEIHSFINPANEKAKNSFIEELKLEIQVHKNKIDSDIAELKELELILEQGKTLDDKENRYIELNNKLSRSISGYDSLPHTYFSQATNDRLDILIKQTEEILNKLG